MALTKTNILITGHPGVGKTTLIRKIADELKDFCPVGFYTSEIREGGNRKGFELVSLDGKRGILSHINIKSPYRVSKYRVDIKGFEDFLDTIPFLDLKTVLIIIDEIGKMECMSDKFKKLLKEILNSQKPVIATIALKGGGLIEEISLVYNLLKNSQETLDLKKEIDKFATISQGSMMILEELKDLSIRDPHTGLYNRRYLLSRLEEEMLRSERHSRPLCLLMLNIDDFKSYTFGQPMGDRVLKAVSKTILNSVRSIDIVSRYGDDEFMIILPETGKTLAISIAERLKNNIAKAEMPPDGIQRFTASIGIVCYPQDGKTTKLILKNVDRALYKAKNKKRNRIEVFS